MTAWRVALSALLLVLVGVPLVLPLAECFGRSDPAEFSGEQEHFARLASNTLILIAGTLLVSMPLGTLGAVLLFRTELPLRRFWIGATVLILFVPVPVLMSAWQALLGRDGWLPWAGWHSDVTRDWGTGFGPAIVLHSLAGMPWVILIVGSGLCWVERELEEEALLHVHPWTVLTRVTLPRCAGSLAVAACWLALTIYAESSIVYFLQVSTFAEEIHTQFSGGDPQALARSVLLSLPAVVLLLVLLLVFVPRLERAVPSLQGTPRPPVLLSLGKGRWLCALAMFALGAGVLAVFLALVWKVGLAGSPRAWSLSEAWARVQAQGRVNLGAIVATGMVAAMTAVMTTALALVSCWLARESRWFRVLVVVLVALAWSLPGPVIGIGLKELILRLDFAPLDALLYKGPSPLPVAWAHLIRFFPVAVALCWPQVRAVPHESIEQARLDGAGPLGELTGAIWPQVSRGFSWVTLVLTALCLGEVAAGVRVDTPGWEMFGKLILDRMHLGADSTVAGLCLLLLGVVGVGAAVAVLARAVCRRVWER